MFRVYRGIFYGEEGRGIDFFSRTKDKASKKRNHDEKSIESPKNWGIQ